MRCYECSVVADKLFPMMISLGRVEVTVYVCKDCLKKSQEAE